MKGFMTPQGKCRWGTCLPTTGRRQTSRIDSKRAADLHFLLIKNRVSGFLRAQTGLKPDLRGRAVQASQL